MSPSNHPQHLNPEIAITRRGLLTFLIGSVISLTLLHSLAVYLQLVLKRDFAYGIVPLFHFDREGNFPTLYSSFALAIASGLSFLIYRWRKTIRDGNSKPWIVLAAMLTFLAIDENASLHDQLDYILTPMLETSGWLAWPWVLPYALLAGLFTIVYLPFYLRMPFRYQAIFGIAAILYVVGTLGLEMGGAVATRNYGEESLNYALLVTIEELMEMSAIILTIHGLAKYITDECSGFMIRFTVHDSHAVAIPSGTMETIAEAPGKQGAAE